MEWRPFTWAHPVMPGFTSKRARCAGEKNLSYSTGNARGPIQDISPLRIFTSCGSSSRLVTRRKFPIQNFRSAKDNVLSSPSVLNFHMVKGFPFLPIRSCLKKIGNSKLTTNIIRSNTISHENAISINTARHTSRMGLLYCL